MEAIISILFDVNEIRNSRQDNIIGIGECTTTKSRTVPHLN